MDINWSPVSRQYWGGAGSQTKSGESIKCSIKLKKLSKPLKHSWSTDFPRDIITTQKKLGFSPAEINARDLYGPVQKLLTQ